MAPGRRVLVLGGGLGMGLKVTQYLLGHHGAKVVVFGLHIAQELQNVSRNSRLKVIKGDVTSGEARKQLFMTVMEFMGGLDCLVWTVGVMGEIQRLVGMSTETLIRTHDINVFAPILMVRAVKLSILTAFAWTIRTSPSRHRKTRY
jgi:NAD(P)-dependent dehydrogenase (short-subunit alcohol dehydrogenase family)